MLLLLHLYGIGTLPIYILTLSDTAVALALALLTV